MPASCFYFMKNGPKGQGAFSTSYKDTACTSWKFYGVHADWALAGWGTLTLFLIYSLQDFLSLLCQNLKNVFQRTFLCVEDKSFSIQEYFLLVLLSRRLHKVEYLCDDTGVHVGWN